MSLGKRFSQVYLEQDALIKDSVRMRNRLSAVYFDLLHSDSHDIVKLIHQETGAKVPFVISSFSLSQFFEQCDIRDLLDSITLIYQYFGMQKKTKAAATWHLYVSRVLKEEYLGYRLDEKGGVHFFIDEEFEKNRSSIVSGLASQPAVQEAFSKSYEFLDQDKVDTANAIRSMFEALEILYKHIINAEGKERLNSHGVQKNIKPKLQENLENKPVELKATEHMMDGLCDWIDAGHMYRHGQKTEEMEAPNVEYAVLFISQGASYLRFLLPMA